MIIGTGVDITEVRRLEKAVERWGDAFLNRVFTVQELENAKKRGSFYQHLAGRFAAKEAIFKAIGDPELNWKEVQIVNDASGKPLCEILKAKHKKICALISISHVKNYAVANAIVTKKGR
ncbi:MAG: holo-ACP synthase [Candidatus Omnitrophica bacterium]|nr:holo-ACP synthase [Candidatus Omnitrophota bacterium]